MDSSYLSVIAKIGSYCEFLPVKAVWQSGHAAACKAAYAGPIPASASNILCPGGETGRRKGFKIPRW